MKRVAAALLLVLAAAPGAAQTIKGSVLDPTPENVALTWSKGTLTLPAALAGGSVYQGAVEGAPKVEGRHPLVIVMHGSSGVASFVKEYQAWLAGELGLASVAPNSFAIPDRLSYESPVDKATYERVHALRLAELRGALDRALALPWVDPARIAIMGTSEGSVPVARLDDPRPAARLIYAWSCEANYFVEEPRTAIPQATPVLAMISSRDPYFSPANPWNKDQTVQGSCARALKDHAAAAVVIVSGNQHTIVNRPDVRDIAKVFLQRALMAPKG